MIYGDTSFLLALYQQSDAFHVRANKLAARLHQPIALTLVGELELLNNFHRALAAGSISIREHDSYLRQISEDESNGILVRRTLADADLYAQARQFSHRHSREISARTLDILHVSAAHLLGVSSFISFDEKQRLLGHRVGLTVLPR